MIRLILALLLTIAAWTLLWSGVSSYIPAMHPLIGIAAGLLLLIVAGWVLGRRRASLVC